MKPELRHLYIYLTDECNLNCIHCWQSASLAERGNHSNLQFNDCRNFLDDAITMGLKNTTVSGGEPLLNPEFHKFAGYFHENNIKMSIETNGILISDPDIFDTIKNCGIHCAISLDGISPEIHNKHRGSTDAFQRTVRSINKLEREKIYYQLIMAISKFNYHELPPLLDWVKEKCKYCDTFKINVINNLGRGERMSKKGLLFRPEEFPKISEEIACLVETYPFILQDKKRGQAS